MSTKQIALVFIALTGISAAGSAISACVGDDGVTTPPSTTPDGGTDGATSTTPPGPAQLKANGTPCGGGTECTSGQCVDTVCCEAKCDGTCESCNLPGSVGTCAPIPDGTDPDKECPTTPLPTDDAGTADAGDDDGGSTEAGADEDAAVVDAGPPFNAPATGLPPVDVSQCAGHCDGKRACVFAGTDTQCGTAFCGNSTEEGVASCDGAGHCLYGVQACEAYTCPDGNAGCKSSCSGDADCLATFYCDGDAHACKPKLANGTGCTSVTQCQSGVCDTTGKVCCDTDCSGTPGGSCTTAGHIGQCVCSACPSGTCALYYQDQDKDTYGDMNGTVTGGTAVYGCASGPAPTGFVADHTDCFDSTTAIAAQVHPKQTGWFTTAYQNGTAPTSFDYDCSGVPEKEFIEGCFFCNEFRLQEESTPENASSSGIILPPPLCLSSTTCSAANQQATHQCNGCATTSAQGFAGPVGCGVNSTFVTCGTCTVSGGPDTGNSFGASQQQGCH